MHSIPAQPEDVVAFVPRQTQFRATVTFRPAGQPIVCQVEDDRKGFEISPSGARRVGA